MDIQIHTLKIGQYRYLHVRIEYSCFITYHLIFSIVFPLAPYEPPHLFLPENPYPSVYRVNVSTTTQEATVGQMGTPIATSFLFRILRTGNKNAVSYYWLVCMYLATLYVSVLCVYMHACFVQYKIVMKSVIYIIWFVSYDLQNSNLYILSRVMQILCTKCFDVIRVIAVRIYLQRTLNDLLDLVSYACDNEVLVQYKAVNKYGALMKWSKPSLVDVYGRK